MAAAGTESPVVVMAFDASKQAEEAFDCEYRLVYSIVLFLHKHLKVTHTGLVL